MFKMFKLIYLLLLLNFVHRSIEYSFREASTLREIELALNENRITLDELLAESSDNEEDNEISQIDPLFSQFDTSVYKIFHREPDYLWNAQQMIEYRGFKFEAHQVVTEDCYILTMHRIVNPNDNNKNKPPVLLQHGLIDSSTGWLFNTIGGDINDEDDRNLGFALAKRGYDVWLGNYRGNKYSKNHTTFSIKDPQFWKFTFDNHALQDLPAQIAHVQAVSDYDQIAYIGYSQGSLTMFELLAFKPEVSKAIKPYIALAPVAFLGAMPSPLKYLTRSDRLMRLLLYKNSEFLPNSQFSRIFSAVACKAFPGLICKNFLYLISGFSDSQLNSTRMPVYFNHFPAGTSLANIIHFGLNVKSKKAQMLDYMTRAQNLECYNNPNPLQIPFENINHEHMYLINAENDLLSDPKDVELLKQTLTVKFESKTVELKKFGHVDFILSVENDYYVNDYLFKILEDKTPAQTVDSSQRLRLKEFTEETCSVPNRETRCHLDIPKTLKNVY